MAAIVLVEQVHRIELYRQVVVDAIAERGIQRAVVIGPHLRVGGCHAGEVLVTPAVGEACAPVALFEVRADVELVLGVERQRATIIGFAIGERVVGHDAEAQAQVLLPRQ
ncbi:hypothetical protein D3C81_956910 [compost metagenome]